MGGGDEEAEVRLLVPEAAEMASCEGGGYHAVMETEATACVISINFLKLRIPLKRKGHLKKTTYD